MVVKTLSQLTYFSAVTFPQSFYYENNLLTFGDIIIKNEFSTQDIIEDIGKYNHDVLMKSVYFYSAWQCAEGILDPVIEVSVFTKDAIDYLISMLWFSKDNSVNTLFYYTYIPENKDLICSMTHDKYTNCVGEFEVTNFDLKDLEKTIEIIDKIKLIVANNKNDKKPTFEFKGLGIYSGVANKINYNINNRISRALGFLIIARRVGFVVMKISLYMNIYECLFTTDANEIVHKMSERTACYYTDDKTKRLSVFRLIKNCYRIRSRYYHGKELEKDNTFDKIPQYLRDLDGLTREILTRIIMYDSEKFLQPDMEPWFEELVFK